MKAARCLCQIIKGELVPDIMPFDRKYFDYWMDKKGLELGHTYLQGPTPTTLRPRIITRNHMASLQAYSANLWKDSIKLERMWKEGELDHVVQMGEGEKEIARMQPWGGSPALIASDGLFSFGAHLDDV